MEGASHPYTRLLISSLPEVGVRYADERLMGIPGTPPSLLNPPRPGRAIRQCGNGLSATDSRQVRHAEQIRCREEFVVGARTNNKNAPHSSHLRGYHSHNHGGKQGETPAGNITPDGVDGTDELRDVHAGLDLQRPFARQLSFRHAPHVCCSVFHRAQELTRNFPLCLVDFTAGNPKKFPAHIRAIQLACPFVERRVAALLHVGHDSRSGTMRLTVLPLASFRQACFCLWCELQDAH